MALKEEFERQGTLFFRYRSYLPALLLGLFFVGLLHFHYPFGSHLIDTFWELFCLVIAFLGLGIRVYTVGHAAPQTSGRNSRKQVADSINTSGFYSIVRHPLYLGNFLIWLGISLLIHIWWVSLMTILLFIVFYERIMFTEEEFLRNKFGTNYITWADQTPLFFPNFKNWRRPDLPFSFKKALKGEYSTFFAIIFLVSLIEIGGDFLLTKRFMIDPLWKIIFLISLAFYLVVRFLALRTTVLNEPGR